MPERSDSKVKITTAMSTIRASAAEHIAAAFVTGVDNAEQNNVPLSQKQQIYVLAMCLMAYHDVIRDVQESLTTEANLQQLVREVTT